MSKLFSNQSLNNEISTESIIDILMRSWRVILLAGVLGLSGAVGYLYITPNQFESISKIQLELPNVEDKVSIILIDSSYITALYSLPTSFSFNEIRICGLSESKSPGEELVRSIKFSSIKGVSTIVELKVRLKSKDLTLECSNAIYEMIREHQNKKKNSYLENQKSMLKKNQIYQKTIREQLTLSKNSDFLASTDFSPYSNLLGFLMQEEVKIISRINTVEQFEAKLIAPIYSSGIPVYPSKRFFLIFGLLGGVVFGGVLAIFRAFWFLKYKIL